MPTGRTYFQSNPLFDQDLHVALEKPDLGHRLIVINSSFLLKNDMPNAPRCRENAPGVRIWAWFNNGGLTVFEPCCCRNGPRSKKGACPFSNQAQKLSNTGLQVRSLSRRLGSRSRSRGVSGAKPLCYCPKQYTSNVITDLD
jgi:hypothetical protein